MILQDIKTFLLQVSVFLQRRSENKIEDILGINKELFLLYVHVVIKLKFDIVWQDTTQQSLAAL